MTTTSPLRGHLHRACLGIGFALAALALLGASATAHAQHSFGSITTRADSNITVKVTGYFSELPNSGYAPLRVEITNKTKSGHKFNLLTINSASYEGGMRLEYSTGFAVDSGETRVFEVMAPLATMNDDESIYNTLRLIFNGPSVTGSDGHQSSQFNQHSSGGKPVAHYVALSKRIFTNLGGKITDELDKTLGISFVGGTFDPAIAPSDWRAYAGVDALFITLDELESMSPGAVAALLDWVSQGGRLYLLVPDATQTPVGLLGTPELRVDNGTWRKGLGQIERIKDEAPDPTARAISRMISRDYNSGNRSGPVTSFSHLARTGYDQTWSLQKLVRSLSLNAPIILIFMLGFAILVGPVNLFVFAKAKQRYRLFITTPLISLGTSLLLFIVILLQDGTGGAGARTSTVYLMPGENKMVQIQEQLSRTGLLFGQNFILPEFVYPAQVLSHNKRLTYQPAEDFGSQSLDLKIAGNSLSGDWFRSRERQAQIISAVSPTRGNVTVIPPVTPDGPPSIESSIGIRLKEFYYRGGEGSSATYWKAQDVDPGGVITLKPASKEDMERFVADTIRATGKRNIISFDKRRMANEPFFVAEAERTSPDYTYETLSSIQWKTDRLYFVSFLGRNGLAPAAAPAEPGPIAPDTVPDIEVEVEEG